MQEDKVQPHTPSTNHNILILGGFGMLGTDMYEALSKETRYTLLVTRYDSATLDITNQQALTDTFEKHRPAWIINCAAYTAVDQAEDEPKKAMEINGYALEKIARAAKAIGAKVMHFSTDYVFDGRKPLEKDARQDTPLTKGGWGDLGMEESSPGYKENDPKNPLSVYGKSKTLGEDLLMNTYPEGSFIIRTSWLYGEHGKNFVHTILRLARERDELRIVNDQHGSPTWTRHLALAVRDYFILPSLSEQEGGKENVGSVGFGIWDLGFPQSGIYHLPNSLSCTWYEFAREIVERSGLKTKVIPISTAEYPTKATRPKNSILLNTKLPLLPTWQQALSEFLASSQGAEH